ncbi:hypothetical protein Tco_0492486 [Tanacetum coccineum]
MAISTVIYFIWNERNKRLFTQDQRICQCLLNGIVENMKLQLLSLKIKRYRNVQKLVSSNIYQLDMHAITMGETLEMYHKVGVHHCGDDMAWVGRVLVESVVVSLDSTNTFAKEDRKDIQEGKCSKAWKGPSCMVMGAIACTMMPSLVSDYAIVDVG